MLTWPTAKAIWRDVKRINAEQSIRGGADLL